ncbi:hypothetical protein EJ04DRAFT_565719 [Polyplosphaeria fusca]|uniref:Peptidase S28 n=1 Tax=Polyplosphaeria fusca TaxID=682080 RepID=A0A9P4QWU5_9PLEO|nr:hypothetical protein EJ04DRAFT_565719 [Polyplosphaeria fusca]
MQHVLYALVTLACAAASASTPTPEAACEYRHLTQRTDHFGKHNGSFQQRFSIIDDYFKPGGPILLFQGEETDLLDCANDTILYEWAQELGGLAVSLEHRYFGPSKPFGNASTTNANFKFLTLDNVMADAVEFIAQLRANMSDAKDSKVVVASGSYGGFLTGAFRLNHPDTFDVAVASAGPAMGFGDASDPESYNWYNWLNRLYLDHSLEASLKIKDAFSVLLERLVTNDTSTLQQELDLCTPVAPGNMTQAALLEVLLGQVFSMAPEFNYPYANPGRTPIATPFFKILDIALNQSDPMKLLLEANRMWYTPAGATCLDFEHPTEFVRTFGVPLINYEVWGYITCTYVPITTTGFTANGTIFPTRTLDMALQAAACEAQYGALMLSKAEMETRYHFSPEEIQKSTHIIWSKGEYDPTSGVEPLALPLVADRHASRTLYAMDVAHREDLFRSHENDRESTKRLRKQELEIIKSWLSDDI